MPVCVAGAVVSVCLSVVLCCVCAVVSLCALVCVAVMAAPCGAVCVAVWQVLPCVVLQVCAVGVRLYAALCAVCVL